MWVLYSYVITATVFKFYKYNQRENKNLSATLNKADLYNLTYSLKVKVGGRVKTHFKLCRDSS